MKLRHYTFAITLIVITLFSSCKQSLNMQGDYEENQEGATINNDNSNTAVLFEAVRMGDLEIVKDLIKLGADLNIKNENGDRPLHWAAEEDNIVIARLLIKSGADLNVKDNDGETPLHTAAFSNNIEIAKLLIQSGAEASVTNNYGWTPLHVAVEYGNKEVVELLIKVGADLEAKDEDGDMPLHIAAEKGNTEAAELLINRGADVNAKDNEDMTPLHLAAETNNLGFCNLIKDIVLGNNEEYNTQNKVNRINKLCCLKHFLIGKSILFNSLYDKNLISGVVKLSELSVDISITNRYDQTPLDIARDKGHVAIIEILEELENVIKNDQLISFTNYITSK